MQINEHKLYILSNYRPEYPLNSFNYVSMQSTFICLDICVCVCDHKVISVVRGGCACECVCNSQMTCE